jgi:hypothetical protein
MPPAISWRGNKNLLEEIAKYDDTNELKEEQRKALLYLVEISVIALSRTILS